MSLAVAEDDRRVREALAALRRTIAQRFPLASFSTCHGEDPAGVYLVAAVQADQTEALVDAVIDQLLAFQIDHGLPVYVLPRVAGLATEENR